MSSGIEHLERFIDLRMSGRGGNVSSCNFLRRSELCEDVSCNMCRKEETESLSVSKIDTEAVCPTCGIQFDVFYKRVCKFVMD